MPLVMSAEVVLDVGCGTGELLHLARRSGHTGRLCGVEPAAPMLDQAAASTRTCALLCGNQQLPKRTLERPGERQQRVVAGRLVALLDADEGDAA
ncbi:MAG: methyltransferase domain-containing protein [Dehalococcoidia bacterium]